MYSLLVWYSISFSSDSFLSQRNPPNAWTKNYGFTYLHPTYVRYRHSRTLFRQSDMHANHIDSMEKLSFVTDSYRMFVPWTICYFCHDSLQGQKHKTCCRHIAMCPILYLGKITCPCVVVVSNSFHVLMFVFFWVLGYRYWY